LGARLAEVIRAVLDTNAIVSALVFRGPANAMVPAWQAHRFTFLVSKALLGEYIRVLHYPKFRLSAGDIRYLVEEALLPFVTPVRVRRVAKVIREDPADDQVLACAVTGEADLIVSGDHHLLRLARYQDVFIVTIADFLQRL
jgi:putative PIN family toxin of toxin-antitoxin system